MAEVGGNFQKFEHWLGHAWTMSRCFGRLVFFLVYLYFRFPQPLWLSNFSLLLFTISLDVSVFFLMTLTVRMEGQSKILENALLSCLDMFLMLTAVVLPLGYMHVPIPREVATAAVAYGILTMAINTSVASSSWEEDWDSGTTMRKEINTNEKAMASQEEDEAKEEEKAGRTATNQEEQTQESETKCEENMKTLLNEEEQPDVAAELNCQGDDDKWVDEKQNDQLAELRGAMELYQEKERKYGALIEKCNQNRNELCRVILQRAVSSAEYYRALYIDCYGTCRKVMEQNVILIEKLCSNTCASADEQRLHEIIDQLEYKCRLLEQDKEKLTASILAANAAAELYRGYLHDSI